MQNIGLAFPRANILFNSHIKGNLRLIVWRKFHSRAGKCRFFCQFAYLCARPEGMPASGRLQIALSRQNDKRLKRQVRMKKAMFSFGMAALLLSCGSVKNAVTVSDLEGEWNIIELNGTAVVPAPNQPFPSIGFSTTDGRVYGNSGCNRLMGSIDLNANPGEISLGNLGSTRMMCPDMTLERNVLSALAQVKKYRKLDDGNMALCSSSKRPILVLQKKEAGAQTPAASLNGRWEIEQAGGQPVPKGMEKQPFLEFDMAQKRLHGNAGCNVINGSLELGEADGSGSALTFGQVISTMMACPDMEVESRILQAINSVKSFGVTDEGNVELYNESGTVVLLLKKSGETIE